MSVRRTVLLATVTTALLLVPPAGAADWWRQPETSSTPLDSRVVREDVHDASRVNWVDGSIEVMAGAPLDPESAVDPAHAALLAKQTARRLAYERLAETIAGIRVTSDSTFDRELMLDPDLRSSVQAMIREAAVVSESVSDYPDGSTWAEVVLGVRLKGHEGLGGLTSKWILPRERRERYVAEWEEDEAAGDPDTAETASAGAAAATTIAEVPGDPDGLIVDARGLGARPALYPLLLARDGGVLHGPTLLDATTLAGEGLVAYANDLEQAGKLERCGDNPLLVEALAVKGEGRADLVVDFDAADLISATREKRQIRGAVVFVID